MEQNDWCVKIFETSRVNVVENRSATGEVMVKISEIYAAVIRQTAQLQSHAEEFRSFRFCR